MGRLFAQLYDLQMKLLGRRLDSRRRAVVEGVEGRTLELGIGSGLNLPFYRTDATVVGVDPDAAMLRRAASRARDATAAVWLVAAAGEALPFGAGAFDEVVITLALCSVESPERALAEAHRVLKPGGRLRFLEHVRSESQGWARVQDALAPVWGAIAGG